MQINLSIRQQNGQALGVPLNDGQCVFVLGANGTGKSSLMYAFYAEHSASARRISAHRQTWFESSSLSLSPEQRRQTEQYIHNTDTNVQARWREDYSAQRASIAIYDLVDAENVRARKIAGAVDSDDMKLAKELSKKDAPIKEINDLLRLSNIPIEISVRQNDQLMASKSGSDWYGVAELSDGERSALLVAANVLTAPQSTLLLIDEPERHLHRSVISPLLTLLFQKRPDCKFVVSTHDILLPLDNPNARTILIRSCEYNQKTVSHYDVDIVQANAQIDDGIKKDILGSRRKLLFVEGEEKTSLDKPLYSLIFPNVSVVAKGGCVEVESAVAGTRGARDLHWVQAFGIIDNDGRVPAEIAKLKTGGVYALAVYMIESIYYHPEIQRRVAERHAVITGENAATRLQAAKVAALAVLGQHAQRMSSRAIEKKVRDQIEAKCPTQAQIATGAPVNIKIDVAAELATEQAAFQALIANQDLEGIICRYPIRETPALTQIASRLGLKDREQYESAVRKLLMDDASALTFVRNLFTTLYADITA